MRQKKAILAVLLVGMLVVTNDITVAATALKKAQDKKTEAQGNLNEVNRQISNIHSAQGKLQSEMNAYDDQLMMLLTDMEILKGDMEQQELEIAQADEELANAKEKEKQQYEAMKQRIQYMYENGEQSFWTALLEADSITDFLNRVEYVNDVYKYDRELLTDYQETVDEVTALTELLANEMLEMEELQISYEEQQASLESIIAKKRAEIADFDKQLVNAEALASKYAKTIRQQNEVIEKEIAKKEEEERRKKEEERKRKEEEERKKREEEGKKPEAPSSENNDAEPKEPEQTEPETKEPEQTEPETKEPEKPPGGTSNGLTEGGLNPSFSTNVSGDSVVSYAQKFLGNPYVFGGNSLTNGTDCSGFVSLIYKNFGISLPRSSYELRYSGKAVSYENAKPGDIICYPGHVAIYIGGGRIIHASSPKTGICYGNATYRTIVAVRRVL